MADVTGITYNFIKKGGATTKSTAENITDEYKPKAEISDSPEETLQNIATNPKKAFEMFRIAGTISALKSTLEIGKNAVISSISSDSPTLKRQVSALTSGVSKLSATAAAYIANPIAGMIGTATDVANYAVNEASFSREVAWADYDREQEQERRGYFTSHRSRR